MPVSCQNINAHGSTSKNNNKKVIITESPLLKKGPFFVYLSNNLLTQCKHFTFSPRIFKSNFYSSWTPFYTFHPITKHNKKVALGYLDSGPYAHFNKPRGIK